MLKKFVAAMNHEELADLLEHIGQRVFYEQLLPSDQRNIAGAGIIGVAANLRRSVGRELNDAEKEIIRHPPTDAFSGKIQAIKMLRERNHGMGLKEGKDIVDAWARANGY